MYPKILHIYGPISIQSYGLMIALGFLLLVYNLYTHPKRKALISDHIFWNLITWGLLVGIVGGRLLFVLMSSELFSHNWLEIFYPWEGGFSILGTILALLIFLPIYLKIHKIKVLEFLDIVAIYSPLMQAISRLGCFLAGCCFGCIASSKLSWAVCYTNPECLAPVGVCLHPTQLYSAFASFLIFLLMRYLFARKYKKAGQLVFIYLGFESLARFLVDFWRGDRELLPILGNAISNYQLIAAGLFIISIVGLIFVSRKK